ncbi:selenocysteine lyase, PLP-dependent [Legionella hackeliae]|nr:aminotransferase class V-fold PLP-dependent enzyme [Legionella hackeliae]STX47571.1 selenocysteine lyase, PLP-dependent [Legionella hackeliae]
MIDVIANDESGQLDLHSLERKLDKHVKLIAITHVPTQGGLINPAQGVGKLANQHNIPFLLDATQSVGQMPIDVQSLQCDFLCATGRKYLRGPRGTGFLYIKKNRIEQCDPPFVDLHSATWSNDNDYILRDDALRFETWEQNIAAKIGLGEAIRYALRLGLPAIWQRIEYLSTVLRQQLLQTDGIVLHDQGKNKCGIVTFTSNKKTPEEIQQALAERNINVSVSLQEYARLDLAKRNLPALVRASVHYYNIEEEVAHFCDAIKNFSL